MNIAISRSLYAQTIKNHLIATYEIEDVTTVDQLVVEVASPILLRMEVPVDQLQACLSSSSIEQVIGAAKMMVSSLCNVPLLCAAVDIGSRVFITGLPKSVLQQLGFAILDVKDSSVSLSEDQLAWSTYYSDNLLAGVDRLVAAAQLARRHAPPKKFELGVGSRTVPSGVVDFIYEEMIRFTKERSAECQRLYYDVWVYDPKISPEYNVDKGIPYTRGTNATAAGMCILQLSAPYISSELEHLVVKLMIGDPGISIG